MILYKKYQTGGTYITHDKELYSKLKVMEKDSSFLKSFSVMGDNLVNKFKAGDINKNELIEEVEYLNSKYGKEAEAAIERIEEYNKKPFTFDEGKVKEPKKVIYKEKKKEEVKKEKPKVDKMVMRSAAIVSLPISKELKPKIELDSEDSSLKDFKEAVYKYVTVITTDKDGNRTVTREKSTVPYAYKLEGVGNWILNDKAQDVIYRTVE